MAICPHCEEDISEWAQHIETATHPPSTPKVWTCPACDCVLGITDWSGREGQTED